MDSEINHMGCQLDKGVMGWENESRNDVAESKTARKMLCFTIETAVVGRKGRICETAGAGYVRAMFALSSQ